MPLFVCTHVLVFISVCQGALQAIVYIQAVSYFASEFPLVRQGTGFAGHGIKDQSHKPKVKVSSEGMA